MFNHSRSYSKILNVLVLLSLLLSSAIFPRSVFANSTITVTTTTDELNTDGDCSLREAIQAANDDTIVDACAAGSGVDTITVPSGIYTLTIDGIDEDGNATGDFDLFDSLTINGAGASTTIIQAGNTPELGIDRVFDIFGAGNIVNISNVTIANGYTLGVGGGIYQNDASELIVTNSIFSDNYADDSGGSIYSNMGVLTIRDSMFSDNSVYNYGGGIYIDASNLTVANSTFSSNSAFCGGGIYNSSGTVIVKSSTFSNNSVECIGGGISNFGTMTVTNSTFSANSAINEGGGIFNAGDLTVTNSTLSANSAGYGAGIYNLNNLHLINTILANSTSGEDCYNDFGTIGTNINNLIETNGSDENMCGTPTLSVDPSLDGLIGSPAYFPLKSNSPALNAGDDASCATSPVSNTSQNGVIRPQGPHCDIGSFELEQFQRTVKSINTKDGWILESSETSGRGGTLNNTATTFNLGDDSANRQYRAILHFNTAFLPDNAVILSATLKIKKQKITGSNPFSILGGLKVDMRKPAFGTASLTLADFKSAPGKKNVATFGIAAPGGWYSAILNNVGRTYINRTGSTQFRLYFTKDDNNDNGNDFMKFFSGNAPLANRPQLIIEYYIP